MHHALEIQEILVNIFGHYRSPYTVRETTDLAALARTCRAFKEPALNAHWDTLDDLSPIARCLPEASHRLSPGKYSFSRPITLAEWDILQSYACRIRAIYDFQKGLDWESVATFLNPPTTRPLFPNLRYLRGTYIEQPMPLLHLPLPSLVSLNMNVESPHVFQNSLQSFPKFSPMLRKLCIYMNDRAAFSKFEPNYICRWKGLESVDCPQVALDSDDLVHLSRMPALTWLRFTLRATLPSPNSPLSFLHLHDFRFKSESLEPISRLLSQTQLPAVTTLAAYIGNCPSRHELSSFFTGVQTSGAGRTVKNLWVIQSPPSSDVVRSEALVLGLQELWPCMAFSNLRCIKLNITWKVDLTDSALLALASAWQHVEHFAINADFGWNTSSGITPNGLVQLLQTCRSLSRISLAVDTRGFTEVPPSESMASLAMRLPYAFYIDVLDSVIEADSVPVIAAFFAGIAPHAYFYFNAWHCSNMAQLPEWEEYKNRWEDAYRQANDTIMNQRPRPYLNIGPQNMGTE